MALIKKLHGQEKARIEGAAAAPAQAESSAMSALDGMLSDVVKEDNPPAPAPAPALPAAGVLSGDIATAVPSSAPELSEKLAKPEKPQMQAGFLKRAASADGERRTGPEQPTDSRAALDYLNILKSLAPVFKAAFVYPGHDAAPEQVGAAVRKMSQASVGLADYIVRNGDQLEMDSAWAKRNLHDFTADLVANHWISTVLRNGGVVAGHAPDVKLEYFIPAVKAVMELPLDLPAPADKQQLSFNGAVQIALLKAMTPLVMEVERYAHVINARIPAQPVQSDALVQAVSAFVMEQATAHYERFVADNTEVGDDDRKVMVEAMIGQSSGVLLAAWELCRGEALGAIQEATSAEEAAAILQRPEYTHGYPLDALKRRAADSLRRLTGTAQYAMQMMRQSGGPNDRKGV